MAFRVVDPKETKQEANFKVINPRSQDTFSVLESFTPESIKVDPFKQDILKWQTIPKQQKPVIDFNTENKSSTIPVVSPEQRPKAEDVKVRIPFGTKEQTADAKTTGFPPVDLVIRAGAELLNLTNRLIELPAKATVQTKQNIASVKANIKGEFETPLTSERAAFNLERLGFDDEVISTGERANRIYEQTIFAGERAPEWLQTVAPSFKSPIAWAGFKSVLFSVVPDAADVLFAKDVTTGLVREASATLSKAAPDIELVQAWNQLGRPQNLEAAAIRRRQVLQQSHPDTLGGDEAVFKSTNNAFNLLKEKGVPSENRAVKLLKDSLDLLQKDLVSLGKTETRGAAQQIGIKQLPGTAEVEGQAPALGLSTREVKPVGRGAAEIKVGDDVIHKGERFSIKSKSKDGSFLLDNGLGKTVWVSKEGSKNIQRAIASQQKVPEQVGETPGPEVSKVENYLQKTYSRTTEKATQTQLREALSKTEDVLLGEAPALKAGSPARGFDMASFERVDLVSGYEPGVLTDGFILIKNKRIAREFITKKIEKEARSFQKQFDLSYADLQKKINSDIESVKEKAGKFPDIDKITPDLKQMKPAKVTGVFAKQGALSAVVTDGNTAVVVDADKLAFVRKHLPGTKIKILAENRPIAFEKNGKIVGLLMPKSSGTPIPDALLPGAKPAVEKRAEPKAEQKTNYDTPEIIKARAEQEAAYKEIQAKRNTPERIQLREKITEELLQLGSFSGDGFTGEIAQERVAYIVMGPSAAGKSSVFAEPLSQQHKARILDSDMAKERIPEYENGRFAGAVHEESVDILEEVSAQSLAKGENVILPVVGKTLASLRNLRDNLIEAGYTLHLRLNDLPADKAAQRAVDRFEQTNRFVDPDYVVNKVDGLPGKNYQIIKNEPGFASFEHISNDVQKGEQPITIEKGGPTGLDEGSGGVRGVERSTRSGSSGQDVQGQEVSVDPVSTTKEVSNISTDGVHKAAEILEDIQPIKQTPKKAAKHAQETNVSLDVPEETKFQYLKRRMQDKFARLKIIQEKIERKQGPLSENEDAYLQAELFPGRAAEQLAKVEQEVVNAPRGAKEKALLQRMRDDGVAIDELDAYMKAQHAPERNARVAELVKDTQRAQRNPELLTKGSGMTNEQAQTILEKFEKEGRTEKLEQYAQEFREKVLNRRLQILQESGLEKEESIAMIKEAYKNYVPLKVAGKEQGFGVGKGFSVQGKDVKRVKGSTTANRTNAVAQGLMELERTIIRSEKNKVSQSLLELAEANPDPKIWEVESVRYVPRFDAEGEIVSMDPRLKFADNVVQVRVDGKLKLITINDPALARAMKNLGTERSIKFLTALNSYLRAVNTVINPEFVITNFERDIQTAFINMTGEQGIGMSKSMVKNIPAAMRGIASNVRNGGTGTEVGSTSSKDRWAQLYQEMKDQGGRVGWFDHKNIEQKTKDLLRAMERYNSDKTSQKLARVYDTMGQYITAANEVVESAARLSAYKASLDIGMTKAKAAQLAKNLTVNFNKKGELGVALNTAYLFANAGIQGTARIFTAMKHPRTRKIVGAVVVLALGLSELNRAINEEEWERIPDHVKNSNLIFMTPGGNHFKIRAPYGYNIFWALGNTTDDIIRGNKTFGQASKNMLLAADQAFNPIGGGSALQILSPTFLDPFVQLQENKTWYGGPIAPEQLQFGPAKPDSQLYFGSVREISRVTAQFFNQISGGSTTEAGAVDVSPETLDHWIDFMTGGAGRVVTNTIETGVQATEGELPDVQNMPFIRQLVGTPSESIERTDVFELAERAETSELSPTEIKQFREAMGEALKREQIDTETGEKILRGFLRSQARITAGRVFDEVKSGTPEDRARAVLQLNPMEREELIKIIKAQAKSQEKLQKARQ